MCPYGHIAVLAMRPYGHIAILAMCPYGHIAVSGGILLCVRIFFYFNLF